MTKLLRQQVFRVFVESLTFKNYKNHFSEAAVLRCVTFVIPQIFRGQSGKKDIRHRTAISVEKTTIFILVSSFESSMKITRSDINVL